MISLVLFPQATYPATADVFPDIASLPLNNNGGGREVTTRNTATVAGYQPGSRLPEIRVSQNLVRLGEKAHNEWEDGREME